ncbi:hypothetical protein [Thalassomonas haliotis]|uniref:Uncharacterized protein n=1 Tax=Thalassomonas haliotis TaxID=485448 RepID=A0ABY7VCC1_9GAMM|nr:hypothetical protein [Thalassomonas haliotis]WDE11191.1 hypothetical protein H3N35_23635 [Thalassomonas haliotis]
MPLFPQSPHSFSYLLTRLHAAYAVYFLVLLYGAIAAEAIIRASSWKIVA